MMAVMGVRISWLMLARNWPLACGAVGGGFGDFELGGALLDGLFDVAVTAFKFDDHFIAGFGEDAKLIVAIFGDTEGIVAAGELGGGVGEISIGRMAWRQAVAMAIRMVMMLPSQ